ncbi:MAG: hypothetical protein RIA69_17095 [Cyclobacteriaceae bacterium]
MNNKQEVSKSTKVITIIIGSLMFIGMGTGYYMSQKEKNAIFENKAETIAVVKQVYSQISRGETCEYEFTVNNQKYSGHQALGKARISVGDSVRVQYSSEDPSQNIAIIK